MVPPRSRCVSAAKLRRPRWVVLHEGLKLRARQDRTVDTQPITLLPSPLMGVAAPIRVLEFDDGHTE